MRFHVCCLSYTSRVTGHSTPPLPHSKRETEGSRCPSSRFSSGGGLFSTTPLLPRSNARRKVRRTRKDTYTGVFSCSVCFLHRRTQKDTSVGVSSCWRDPSLTRNARRRVLRTRKDTSIVSFRARRLSNMRYLTHAEHEETCWCLFMLVVFPPPTYECRTRGGTNDGVSSCLASSYADHEKTPRRCLFVLGIFPTPSDARRA